MSDIPSTDDALAAVFHRALCPDHHSPGHATRNARCVREAYAVLVSDWLRDRDAALRAEGRAEAAEEIAAAIEANIEPARDDDVPAERGRSIGMQDAAQIARAAAPAPTANPVVPSDKSAFTGRYK